MSKLEKAKIYNLAITCKECGGIFRVHGNSKYCKGCSYENQRKRTLLRLKKKRQVKEMYFIKKYSQNAIAGLLSMSKQLVNKIINKK